MPHKDQDRAKETFLARFLGRTESENASDVRDCTVLVRLFEQGPDPLYLMETCPRLFKDLCRNLGISEEDGRKGIEDAHWFGPGMLLYGSGLPIKDPGGTVPENDEMAVALNKEALWVLMASASSCVEGGYDPNVTEREKVAIAQSAALELYKISVWDRRELMKLVKKGLAKMVETIEFTVDERGFPHTDDDHGFYLAYKLGHEVCAVKAGPHTFWGTIPGVTLEELNIKVDKNISPSYGIVFGKEG